MSKKDLINIIYLMFIHKFMKKIKKCDRIKNQGRLQCYKENMQNT